MSRDSFYCRNKLSWKWREIIIFFLYFFISIKFINIKHNLTENEEKENYNFSLLSTKKIWKWKDGYDADECFYAMLANCLHAKFIFAKFQCMFFRSFYVWAYMQNNFLEYKLGFFLLFMNNFFILKEEGDLRKIKRE